jgi:hypothetical protein
MVQYALLVGECKRDHDDVFRMIGIEGAADADPAPTRA